MKKVKGYSLTELSVVIIVLGLVISLLYIYYPRTQEVEQKIVVSQGFNTTKVDQALYGFAYAHSRLPFADSDGDGLENVGSNRGTVPFVTLGLASRPVNNLNIPLVYALFRKANTNNQLDADLAVKKDRLYALLPSGTRTAGLTSLGESNTIDFCYALRTAANITSNDATALHVSKTGYNRNVAYVLVDVGATDADGNGQLLDGLNVSGLNFEVAGKPKSAVYDDQVKSTDFAELFGALSCGAAISAALHAHDNVVLAADAMHTSFTDYSRLLRLSEDVAEVGTLLATAAILQAVAGIADSAAAGASALAETLIPPPAVFQPQGSAGLALIAASAVVATGATVAAALTQVTADDALEKVEDARDCFDSGTGPLCTGTQEGLFVSKMNTLRTIIRQNAVAADRAGL